MALPSRLLRSSLAPTIIIGSALYATSSSLAAEESRPLQATKAIPHILPGRSRSGEKLPIYPNPDAEPPVTLVETPSPIAPYIAQARITTTDALSGVQHSVQAGVSKWISFERGVEREVKSVLPPDEPLTPGIIYVLIAGLTGSVLSRTRAFPIRFLAPPLFTLAAMPYFLPKTAHNLRQYLSNVEDQRFPDLAARHDSLNANLEMHWEMVRNRVSGAGQGMERWSRSAVEGIERGTGLKVGDVVKRGQATVDQLRERVEGGGKGTQYERVGYVVEQTPVAEIVRPVGEEVRSESRAV